MPGEKEGKAVRTAGWLLVVLVWTCGAATLFEDDFDDGNADGWTEYSNYPDSASYYVENGWYHLKNTNTGGFSSSYNGDVEGYSPHQMSDPDYAFVCRTVAFPGVDHLGFAVRFQSPLSGQNGYVMWLRYMQNDVVIWRHLGGVTEQIAWGGYNLDYEEEYWIRFEVFGDLLRGKVWQGEMSDEPDEFLVSGSDGTFSEPGSIGMVCHSYGTGLKHAAFDLVIVTDSAYDLASFTWGGIKGSF